MLARKLTRKRSREQAALGTLLANRYQGVASPTAIPTLVQNGSLAVLLEQRHRRIVKLARRSEHHKHLRETFRRTFILPFQAAKERMPVDGSFHSLIRLVTHHPHKSFTRA